MNWSCPERASLTNARGEPVRVLNVHNYHAQRGGYDVFYESVGQLLRELACSAARDALQRVASP